MIGIKINQKILSLLSEIAKEENVYIFYACESGSRAWGFPSTDSDYDVRFLYLRPFSWYLTIEEGRDVIERPINDLIDLSGWDFKKALKLFRKSNPPLLEWLRSGIIYVEKSSLAEKLRALIPEFYSPVACLYHYLHMAQGNFRDYLRGDRVWTKKYFYIIRPILACLWIEREQGPVPMEFETLVERIVESNELRKEINELLKRKREGEELSWGPPIPIINEFIEGEIFRLVNKKFEKRKIRPGREKLNALFQAALVEIWGLQKLEEIKAL
jgi:predicted nucleotidyltransferase